MPFDTALSGIRAASNDLSITGNNIANASTTGFKSSRAEFGDVYATSVLGGGQNPIGNGVRLQSVSQRFTQGSVAFTENELDLAVNGNGFFVVRSQGEQFYTRAGAFGLDREGFVTSNTGARLQGFPADQNGNITGLQNDLRIETANLAPRATTLVESMVNLDSSEEVLQSTGTAFRTEGNAIAVARSGLEESTTTNLPTGTFGLVPPLDFTNNQTISFNVELTNSSGNNGNVNVTLNTANGVPSTINNFNDLRTLAGAINAQIFQPTAPATPIDVIATAVDAGGGNYRLEFSSLQSGEPSQIDITNVNGGAVLGLPADATSVPGIAAVGNGYPQQSIDIVDPKGNVVTYTSAAGASAATIGSEMNALTGVSATATTNMRMLANEYVNSTGNLEVTLNGVTLAGNNLESLGRSINELSSSTLPGITAELDPATGDLMVSSSVGDNLRVTIGNGAAGDTLGIVGNTNATPEILEIGLNDPASTNTPAEGNAVVIGGTLDLVLAEGYSARNAAPPSIGLFGSLTPVAFTEVVLNEFDPADKATYNHATSMPIYDSLGNQHILTQYFVRQEYDPNDPTTQPNHWVMFVQIDGRDVGDPDTTLPPPENTVPTRAAYNLRFNEDGSLNRGFSDQVLISNWTPRDANGELNGSLGPQNALAGGTINIPTPPTSSNVVIDMAGTTQFGSAFSVDDVDQNGYTTGRLSGLNIDKSGVIFARFTNGESQVLGQVVLADFANNQGLQPVGDSMWAENFESGPPNVGTPGTAALGAIQAGALEESNVDLSEELVRLIIAQRNFQASAKTIETANQVTQTVINLR
jgi:flagellar hook protein FlgE